MSEETLALEEFPKKELEELERCSREELGRRWLEHSRCCRLIEVIAERRARKVEGFDLGTFNPQHPISMN